MKKTILGITTLLFFTLADAQKMTSQYFNVEIKGSGEPMILIPGLTCPGNVWNETVAEFEQSYECHIVSLAGFAGTPAADYGDSFTQTMTDKLVEYIKVNKINKPVVTGHSLGGFIALKIAIQESDMIQSLVIVDALPFLPAIMMPGATVESVKPMTENLKKNVLNPMDSAFKVRQRGMLKTMMNAEERVEMALRWMLDSDQQTVADAMYDLYTNDLRESLTRIDVPVLVLGAWIAYKNYGVTRESTMANFKAQYGHVKNLTLDLTGKGNHFIMWDDPDFFYARMRNFLSSNK